MKRTGWRRFLRGASLQEDFEELKRLTIKYVKDETVTPVKELGRFLLYGVVGSIFVAFGVVLLLLGALRYLQWQFPVFNGSLSWLPYVIVAALCVVVIGLTVWRIVSGTAKKRIRAAK